VGDEADKEQLHPAAERSRQGPIALLETAHRYAPVTFTEKSEDLGPSRPDPPGTSVVVQPQRGVGEEGALAVRNGGSASVRHCPTSAA
jgi:hypothetical protein